MSRDGPPRAVWFETDRISAADPLGADQACLRLPEMNAAADLPALVLALGELLPSHDALALYDVYECLAAMRDIGFFIGSIKRHGREPIEVAPGLEPVLLELGRRTDMIPRDTAHHCTEWNPLGPRERSYTGDPQERCLMDSGRRFLPHLRLALGLCGGLRCLDPGQASFAASLDAVAEELDHFGEAMTDVTTGMTPEFFARTLRPYYESIVVGGTAYTGPAGSGLPLYLVDLAVWASDHRDDVFDEFVRDAAILTVPPWRALVTASAEQASLMTVVTSRLRSVEPEAVPETLRRAAHALIRVLRALLVFRGRHMGMARKAYDEEIRLYPAGSGGGSIDLLRAIVDLNVLNAALVRQLLGIGTLRERPWSVQHDQQSALGGTIP
jgi:monodechloroaminopyrrolnitrin synthase